jgi:hypothetical protein
MWRQRFGTCSAVGDELNSLRGAPSPSHSRDRRLLLNLQLGPACHPLTRRHELAGFVTHDDSRSRNEPTIARGRGSFWRFTKATSQPGPSTGLDRKRRPPPSERSAERMPGERRRSSSSGVPNSTRRARAGCASHSSLSAQASPRARRLSRRRGSRTRNRFTSARGCCSPRHQRTAARCAPA